MATTDLGKWMITNGGDYDPDVTYEQLTMVMYDNSTYITLKTVTGVTPSNDQINYALMARGFNPGVLSSVTAVDTSGALGNAGETVSAQSLVDYLADAVMTKLVEKANISNVQVNDSSKVPSAALAYAMQQQITENEEAITGLNSNLSNLSVEKVSITLGDGFVNADDLSARVFRYGKLIIWGFNITVPSTISKPAWFTVATLPSEYTMFVMNSAALICEKSNRTYTLPRDAISSGNLLKVFLGSQDIGKQLIFWGSSVLQ